MNVFQWVFVAFCVLQFCTSVYRFRRSHSLVALLFSLGWFISTILLLNPPLSTRIASIIGIGRGADLVLYTLAFLFLWAHYQHYVRYRRMEENLTELVRELAIARAQGNEV